MVQKTFGVIQQTFLIIFLSKPNFTEGYALLRPLIEPAAVQPHLELLIK